MRNISFHSVEKLKQLISDLKRDSENYKKSFNESPLNVIHWSLQDVVFTEVAIIELNVLLERLESAETYPNSIHDFCIWHLTSVNYSSDSLNERAKAWVWKCILEEINHFVLVGE